MRLTEGASYLWATIRSRKISVTAMIPYGPSGTDLTHSVTGSDALKMICRSVPGVVH